MPEMKIQYANDVTTAQFAARLCRDQISMPKQAGTPRLSPENKTMFACIKFHELDLSKFQCLLCESKFTVAIQAISSSI